MRKLSMERLNGFSRGTQSVSIGGAFESRLNTVRHFVLKANKRNSRLCFWSSETEHTHTALLRTSRTTYTYERVPGFNAKVTKVSLCPYSNNVMNAWLGFPVSPGSTSWAAHTHGIFQSPPQPSSHTVLVLPSSGISPCAHISFHQSWLRVVFGSFQHAHLIYPERGNLPPVWRATCFPTSPVAHKIF